ncbi:hypothetical protein JCM30566_13670 [Marinitoga arctica]
MKVLFLSKKNFWTEEAKKYLINNFNYENVKIASSNKKYQKFPKELINEKGDLLISFLSPWIIPEKVINNFKKAINFHPGPPEYPGTGGYNFALYEESKLYGVTSHYISKEIDAGQIIKVIRFPINKNETVKSLQDRTLSYLLVLFYDIIDKIINKERLPISGEKWKKKALTKKDFEELCRIDFEMDKHEIEKRIHATKYPGRTGAYIEIEGYKFYYKETNKEEL